MVDRLNWTLVAPIPAKQSRTNLKVPREGDVRGHREDVLVVYLRLNPVHKEAYVLVRGQLRRLLVLCPILEGGDMMTFDRCLKSLYQRTLTCHRYSNFGPPDIVGQVLSVHCSHTVPYMRLIRLKKSTTWTASQSL